MFKLINKKKICCAIAVCALVVSAVAGIAAGIFYLNEKFGKYLRYIPTKRNIRKMFGRALLGIFRR